MSYTITQAQWDVINSDCKVVTATGERFFRQIHEQSRDVELVPVIIVDELPPAVIPAHYAQCWPIDPRD